MNLSQLYYFKRLAELQHYTRAAQELNITQPSLSGAIHSLEGELGVDLFKKKGRNIILTDNGEEFYVYVSSALRELDKGKDIMQERAKKLGGMIELGSVNALLSEFIPNAVNAFRLQAGKKVQVRDHSSQTSRILENLQSGKLDVGFCSYDEGYSDLEFIPICKQHLCAACGLDHPLSGRETLSLRDLIDYNLISYHIDMPIAKEIRSFLSGSDIDVDYDFSSEEALVGAIRFSSRVAILQKSPFVINNPQIHLINLENIACDYHVVYMVYNKKIQKAHVVESFIDYMKTEHKTKIPFLNE